MTLELLTAKEHIREVIDRFSNLECDVHAQIPLFTKDVRVRVYMGGQLAMDISGVEDLERQFGAFTVGVEASCHMNGQQVIELDGDRATDVHYCRAVLVTVEDGKKYFSDNYIRYKDTLVCRDGKWLISEREQHFVISERRLMDA